MRYAPFLQPGGTIGFLAPSFGCSMEPYKSSFDNAKKTFSKMGFHTVDGPNTYAGSGVGISAAPQECADEFMMSWLDERSDVLMSCGGGELMCEILDGIDFEKIAQTPPKWFMGYSDNTNLTFLLPTLCDTAAVYAPCAPAFGMQPWHPSVEDAFLLLQGKKLSTAGYPLYEVESLKDETNPLAPYNVTKKRKIIGFRGDKRIRKAEFSGRLIGGCLDILTNLCGTCYDNVAEFTEKYKEDGIIWFLEACDLNVFSIRRALWNLAHAGWFRHVKGFLVGRPLTGQEDMFGLDHINAVMAMLAEYKVPVLLDLDIGHVAPMMPLISGARAEVKLKGQEFELTHVL